MRAQIDTRDQRGPTLLQAGIRRQQYATQVFEHEDVGAERIIARALGPARAVATR
jgi:hypothetical protein